VQFTTDRSLQLRAALTLAAFLAFVVLFHLVVVGVGVVVATVTKFPVVPVVLLTLAVPVVATGVELWSSASVPPEAEPVASDDDLTRLVARLAQAADLPPPSVYRTPEDTPAAYVVGYTPQSTRLVVSSGLLDLLDREELAAVVAHELAHVANRDAAVVTVTHLPTAIAARLMDWAADDGESSADDYGRDGAVGVTGSNDRNRSDGGSDSLNPLFVLAAPLWLLSETVGRLLIASLGRHRQLAADRAAAALTGSPAALATAIRRIDETLDDRGPDSPVQSERLTLSVVAPAVADPEPVRLGPDGERVATRVHRSRRIGAWVRRRLSTHPPVEERVDRLRAMERDVESTDHVSVGSSHDS
jgi:heat shock protein HtpX